MKHYRVLVSPTAIQETNRLPGNVRQRIRRIILAFAEVPHPAGSKRLATDTKSDRQVWRVRVEQYRIIYTIDQAGDEIFVLAIRRRPPYQYEDLDSLLASN